ncbi:hypothetical protein OROMI_014226 [Orobanche minor]
MTLKSIISLAYVALVYLIIPLSKCDQQPNGFTLDLIHTDAPGSPLYDPSASHSQLVVNAFRRSTIRAQSLGERLSATDGKSIPQPDITNDQGNYFIKYSIGSNPSVPSVGTFDTGSDLIWNQCKPCKIAPNKHYQSLIRQSRPHTRKSHAPAMPIAVLVFRYGTYSEGYLSTETFAWLASSTGGGSVSSPKIIFGCGYNNNAQGIVGFGGGKVSLARQIGGGKFSYCLVSLSSKSSSSKLSFGSNAVVSGAGAVSSPLVPDTKRPTFYFVTLKGFSVGNRMLRYSGKIIIDSGTTVTMLPTYLYNSLLAALKSIKPTLGIVPCPKELSGSLCVKTRYDIKNFPTITVHFDGGDVKLNQEHLFARASEDLLVFAVQEAPAGADPIYGSLAQTNFLVGFDLTKKIVSFNPTTCG